MNEYTGRRTDGRTDERTDGRTNVWTNERKKFLNIGFENLNWQEADQLVIYKAQLSSRVEDLTL